MIPSVDRVNGGIYRCQCGENTASFAVLGSFLCLDCLRHLMGRITQAVADHGDGCKVYKSNG